jgi:hypothetical protein
MQAADRDPDRRPAYPRLAAVRDRWPAAQRDSWERRWRYAMPVAGRLLTRFEGRRPEYVGARDERDYVQVVLAEAIAGLTHTGSGDDLTPPSLGEVAAALARTNGPRLCGNPPAAVPWQVWAVAETRCWQSWLETGTSGRDRDAGWDRGPGTGGDRGEAPVWGRWRIGAYNAAADLLIDAIEAGCSPTSSAEGAYHLYGLLSVEVDVRADSARVQAAAPDPPLTVAGRASQARRRLEHGRADLDHPGPGQEQAWGRVPEEIGYAHRLLAPHPHLAGLLGPHLDHALFTHDPANLHTLLQGVIEDLDRVRCAPPGPARGTHEVPPGT